MKHVLHRLVVLLIFVSTGSLTAQATLPTLLPPSPEASALFKFVETPVSLNDGLANISIPIYTIELKEMKIPINLSYHSRGIKVSELASRVGLGWTLSYGGMISRQVRNQPDDVSGYLSEDFYDTFFTDSITRSNVYNREANDRIDMDPDLFFFSFPGYSGKFIFDHRYKVPVIQHYDDLIVEPVDDFDGWRVIDAMGNIFYFGKLAGATTMPMADFETTEDWHYSNNTATKNMSDVETAAINTWHLIKIETYLGEVVNFSYDLENPIYIRRSYDVIEPNSQDQPTCYYSKVDARQYQVSEISFPGGKVVFVPETQTNARLDLPGAFALDQIKVLNNTKEILHYDLDYTTVTSATNTNYLSKLAELDESSNYRMFLSSVQKTTTSESEPPYQLEYSSVKLPNRFSNSQDNWGYYNGADNGPFLTFLDYNGITINRRVDSLLNGAGLLKKITYPTGGSTTLTYEQNIAVKPSFINQIQSSGINPVVAKTDGLGNLETEFFNQNTGTFVKTITFGENLVGLIQSSVDITNCADGTSSVDCNFPIWLSDGTTSYLLSQGITQLTIPAGTYDLHASPPSGTTSDYFHVIFNWEEEDPLEDATGQPLMLAAGKRIKKITYQDGSTTVKTKEYTYTRPDGSNSGKIFGLPNFYSIIEENSVGTMLYKYGSTPGSPLTSLQGNNVGYSFVTEYNGSKTAHLGKTEYTFTNFEDGGTYYEFPYHLPIDNQWLRGKLLTKTVYKASSGSYVPVQKIENTYIYGDEEDLLNYPIHANPVIPALGVDPWFLDPFRYVIPLAVFTHSIDGIDENEVEEAFHYKVYYQTGGTADLYATKQTTYLPTASGTTEVVQETTYSYNYPQHYQLSGSKRLDSYGKSIETRLYYAPEVLSLSSLGYDNLEGATEFYNVRELDTLNRLLPIQKETLVKDGSTIISKSVQRTLFGNWNNIILPQSVETAKLGESLSERIRYHRYDPYGNPVEVSKTDGSTIVYIWGYNKRYPIAKIENATYQQVATALNVSLSGLDNYNESNIGNIQGLRSSLSNALITTLTYEPLVGVKTITNPFGDTTTYQYDALNRLEFIRDDNGKLLKQFSYNYKNN